MSCAARLFNSKSDQTLYSRITPSKDQFAIQQARWNDLRDFLKSRVKDDTGYPTSSWLQGSYKFDTQIRPWKPGAEFDIDLGLYFEWSGGDDEGEYDPEGFKQFVQNALLDYAADEDNDATGVDEPKERCCRISFNPDFHIDVPCYHLDRSVDRGAAATETKGWEESDPKAIYKWFKELFAEAADRSLLRRLVCYMKMWAALRMDDGMRPSSITLTVLVGEALADLDRSDAVDDDDILEGIITAIADRLDGDARVLNPVEQGEDLNRLGGDARFRGHGTTGERRNDRGECSRDLDRGLPAFFPNARGFGRRGAGWECPRVNGEKHRVDGLCLRSSDRRARCVKGQRKLHQGRHKLAAHDCKELLPQV